MKQEKKGQNLGREEELKGLDKRMGKDSLKKDVGLTDKKGDNLRKGKESDSEGFIKGEGRKGRDL
jgi:hypothetical protein